MPKNNWIVKIKNNFSSIKKKKKIWKNSQLQYEWKYFVSSFFFFGFCLSANHIWMQIDWNI